MLGALSLTHRGIRVHPRIAAFIRVSLLRRQSQLPSPFPHHAPFPVPPRHRTLPYFLSTSITRSAGSALTRRLFAPVIVSACSIAFRIASSVA